jgi:hypothetical protein
LAIDQLTTKSGFGEYPDDGLWIDLTLRIRAGFDPQQTIFIGQVEAPSANVSERTQPAGCPVRSLTGIDIGTKE